MGILTHIVFKQKDGKKRLIISFYLGKKNQKLHNIICKEKIMVEKIFTLPISEKNLLKDMKKVLINELKNTNGIITELEDYENFNLLLAYDDQTKNKVDALIKNELIKYFIYYKKMDYFRRNLKLDNLNPILSELFIRALIRYDQKLDEKEVNYRLELVKKFQNLNLESFFYFHLDKLKNQWEKLIQLTNENKISLIDEKSFEELLGFLIANLEPQINEINVVIEDKFSTIYDGNNNILSRKKIKSEYVQLWLLMIFIKFAPTNIFIKNMSKNSNFSWINRFFSKKIQYF